MRISVFGLGYVGVVTSACLAEDGHEICGVDVVPAKVDMINRGRSPIIEEGIDGLVARNVEAGRLRATLGVKEALEAAQAAIVCVGTPSRSDGSLDQEAVRQVVVQIGGELRSRTEPLLLVVRSTVLPGTMRQVVLPELARASGRRIGEGCDVLFHPEFLREGSSVDDFFNPPKILVGECVAGTAGRLLQMYGAKYTAPRIVCAVEVAEMAKYCDNLFHAVKVTFANEVGQFCRAHGINSRTVMEIFCQDEKLNLSARYLKPGFAFGGSCLPKDLRAFLAAARGQSLTLPMLEHVLPSNRWQIERCLEMIVATGARRIGLNGLAFKAGTDDLRESPYVEIAERLIGKGKTLVCYDEKVDLSRMMGRNKAYIDQKLPHLGHVLTGDAGTLAGCELILICHRPKHEQVRAWMAQGAKILDLSGAFAGGGPGQVSCIV